MVKNDIEIKLYSLQKGVATIDSTISHQFAGKVNLKARQKAFVMNLINGQKI